MRTYASNPGNIRVKYLRVLAHSPSVLVLFGGGGAAVSYWGYAAGNLVLSLLGGACLGLLLLALEAARHKFKHGDVNISKVLSLDPPLFATSTNMRNSYGSMEFPVIKIVRRKVPAARGCRWKIGDYFPAVCLYAGSLSKPCWENFFPDPISVATDDLATIDHHSEKLKYLRAEFDARLSLVDTPDKPGIYFIDSTRLAQRRARIQAGALDAVSARREGA